MFQIILEAHCSVHSNKIYTAKHKNTPKFIDHNSEADYQSLIILGTTIPDTTVIKRLLKFPSHPRYAFSLPGEIKTHEIGVKTRKQS